MTTPTSILSGVPEMIDAWCGLTDATRYGEAGEPRYVSKQAAIDLSGHGKPLGASPDAPDATDLFKQILEQIKKNHAAGGRAKPSAMVWKLRKALTLNAENPSSEVILERLVVQLLGDHWSNQLVTASGMMPGADTHRNIDLVHDRGDGAFEFIELKYGTAEQGFGSNHPLFAAWEIVLYGLLYTYARLHLDGDDSKPLLKAKKVHLVVLAPEGYYRYSQRGGPAAPFELGWLGQAINKGLASLPPGDGATMEFAFQKFTEEFAAIYDEPKSLPVGAQAFRKADLGDRTNVYGDPRP